MPVLIAAIPGILWLTGGLGLGAFFGAQVDDKLDNHPYNQIAAVPSWNKIIVYSAAGLALAYGAKKVFLK